MTYSGPTDLYIAGTWRPAAAGARFTVTAGRRASGPKCCGACSRP
jgi:hypothetical protein